MASKAFGTKGPAKGHLVRGSGGLQGEIQDLRSDVEEAMVALEAKTGYPTITKVTGGSLVDLVAIPVAKALTGTGFLQGQTKAALTLGTATAELIFTANRPGTPGNSITVTLATGGAESVAVAGSDITVTLNTGVSSANSVKSTIDSDVDASSLVQVASGGAGVVSVATIESLEGGLGEGVIVTANGIEQGVRGSVTDTSIPLVVTDLSGAANYDEVGLQVTSNGVKSDIIALNVLPSNAYRSAIAAPAITKVTGGGSVSLGAIPIAKPIVGTGFLQGQTAATLTKGTGTASLAFTANRPGTPGNSITVVITQGAAGLVVSAAGDDATIELASANSTANQVKSAWDAEATTKRLAQVVSGGAGVVLISSVEPLAGGLGAGVVVTANGLAQDVDGAVTDTALPMLVTTLAGAANLDKVALKVTSNDVASEIFAVDVVS